MPHPHGRYGAKPDPDDHRDLSFHPNYAADELPKRVDLRKHCPPVHDQGSLGTCTAHAIAAAFQFEQNRLRFPNFAPSRMFIYYNERALQRATHHHGGANLRAGLRAVQRYGVCPERHWPYRDDEKLLHERPSDDCYEEARHHKIYSYRRITIGHNGHSVFLEHLKSCLYEGCPFVFAFLVHKSFESDQVGNTGMMPLPEPREAVITYHAVVGVGYDDEKRHILVRNSWGPSWGIGGYFWMPYEYILRPEVTADFWTIRGVSGRD